MPYVFLLDPITKIDYLGELPLNVYGWDWYDFVIWYFVGFGKDIDLSYWYKLPGFKEEIRESLDRVKAGLNSKVVIPPCLQAGKTSSIQKGTFYGSVRPKHQAGEHRDAIGDAYKVLNAGTVQIDYTCSISQNCSCNSETGTFYRERGSISCSLKVLLKDRFANPRDVEGPYADNADIREACFKSCKKRFSKFHDFFSINRYAEYYDCLKRCNEEHPRTDIVLATPYNITAQWNDSYHVELTAE